MKDESYAGEQIRTYWPHGGGTQVNIHCIFKPPNLLGL